jgi:hypothetical protein
VNGWVKPELAGQEAESGRRVGSTAYAEVPGSDPYTEMEAAPVIYELGPEPSPNELSAGEFLDTARNEVVAPSPNEGPTPERRSLPCGGTSKGSRSRKVKTP